MKVLHLWIIFLFLRQAECLFVETVLENIISRSSDLIAQIPGYYSYDYTAGLPSTNSIIDGGHDMFDKGNIISISGDDYNTTINITYGKTYSFPSHEFISNASQPFQALMYISGDSDSKYHSYFLNVKGNLGSDGHGRLYPYNGTVQRLGYLLEYSVFQITDKTDATICEVFYRVTNKELWKSSANEFKLDIRNKMLDDTDNVVVLEGKNIRGNLLGYTLLSKYIRHKKSSMKKIPKKEIENVLRIMLDAISWDVDECATNSHTCPAGDSICINTNGSYTCLEVEKPDPCSSMPCQNNGTCHSNTSNYYCNCTEGFYDGICSSALSVVKYNDLNITFYSPENGATFYEADKKCESENSELLSVKNPEIQKIVTNHFKSNAAMLKNTTHVLPLTYWLSGGNSKPYGDLKWYDGTPLSKHSGHRVFSNYLHDNCSMLDGKNTTVGLQVFAVDFQNCSSKTLGKWRTSPKNLKAFGFICREKCAKGQCCSDHIIGFHFNKSLPNDTQVSNEKCKNGQHAAVVKCFKVGNHLQFGQVNVSTCHFDNDTFEAKTDKELTLAVEQLGALTSLRYDNITENNTVIISNQLAHISTAVQHNNLSVSSNLLEKVTKTASIISGSFTKLKTDSGKSMPDSYSVVNALENLTQEVNLDDVKVLNISTNNIQLQIADVITEDIIDEVHYKPSFDENKITPIEISVPKEAFNNINQSDHESVRVVFTVFNGSGLYPSSFNPKWVVSAVVGNHNSIKNLSKPVEISHVLEPTRYGKIKESRSKLKVKFVTQTCVYWDEAEETWTHDGCCLDIDVFPPLCKCDHLTSFSILVSDDEVPADIYLSLVSDIGSAFSAAGFFLSGLILLLHKESRRKIPAQIQIHICLNLFLGNLLFLFGIELVEINTTCTVITACLQFTMLSGWCWIAVYSNQLYSALVKVFDKNSCSIMKTSATFAYGFPLLVVGVNCAITLGHFDHHLADPHICSASNNHLKSYYRADHFCWLHGHSLYFGFLLWIGLILLYNFSVMFRVMLNICNRDKVRSTAREHNTFDHLRMALVFSICLGLTWITGILFLFCEDELYNLITSWIFAICNAFQGAFLFYILCIKRKPVFVFWTSSIKKCFGCKITRHFDTEITSSNHDTISTTRSDAVIVSKRKSIKNRKSALERYSSTV